MMALVLIPFQLQLPFRSSSRLSLSRLSLLLEPLLLEPEPVKQTVLLKLSVSLKLMVPAKMWVLMPPIQFRPVLMPLLMVVC